VFDSIDDACRCVSSIIAAGIVPAALEMMDRNIISAVEPVLKAGFPLDAGAILLIEVEGLEEQTIEEARAIERLCRVQHEAREVRIAVEAADRDRLWAARKSAIGALGLLYPNYYVLDGVVPRTKITEVLARVYEIADKHELAVANVFHAGDGNLHPNLMFDIRVPGTLERVLAAGAELMRLCVDAGGSITGEHGVGLEKRDFMPWMFSQADIDAMRALKSAFKSGDLYNPCKAFPTSRGCGELTQAHVQQVSVAVGSDMYV
jgi:glycolate oxidase